MGIDKKERVNRKKQMHLSFLYPSLTCNQTSFTTCRTENLSLYSHEMLMLKPHTNMISLVMQEGI